MQINDASFKCELMRIFKENGFGSLLSLERTEKFLALTRLMLTENEKYNLTAITEPEEIIVKHYADCASLAIRLKKGASLVDVGCGAGFPTLPLAIMRPDIKILAMDSTAKRIAYVEMAARELSLDNVTAVTMRAEDGARDAKLRESFDYATARAVANMRVLTELTLPYLKCGGEFIALKGKNGLYELQDARRAIATLGGAEGKIEDAVLKNRDATEEHTIITVKKLKKTPAAYPRAYAQISKKPL